MDRKELRRLVCKAHCAYYKPLKDEGLACLGFLVIERLFEKSGDRPSGKPEKLSWTITESILSEDLCVGCPYRAEDCDFAAEVEGALPCGGFIFLGILLEKKILSRHELQKTVKDVLYEITGKDLH